MRRTLGLVVGLLVAAQVGGVGAPTESARAGTGPQSTAVSVTATVSLAPDRPGMVRVRAEYDVGSDVATLVVYPPEGYEVRNRTGFRDDPSTTGQMVTDGPTTASLTLLVPANTSAGGGAYYELARRDWGFVDADGLLEHSYWSESRDGWRGEGEGWLRETVRAGAHGVAGGAGVYLGNASVRRAGGDGHSMRLVTATGASAATANRTLAHLRFARRALDVGAPTELTVFSLPAPIYYGFAAGTGQRRDVVMRGDRPVRHLAPTYFHEYVHARQHYSLGPEMEWFTEASASYYGDRLLVRSGVWSYERFYREQTRSDGASAVLAAPSTWTDSANYVKGKRVLAALDTRIRAASGGNASLEDVFRRMNAHNDTVRYGDFRSFAVDIGGSDLGVWVDRYVRTEAVPTPPEDPFAYVRANSTSADPDGDGVPNAAERDRGTNPLEADGGGATTAGRTTTPAETKRALQGTTDTADGTSTTGATDDGSDGSAGTTADAESGTPGFGMPTAVAALLAALAAVALTRHAH